jgi:DNA-binding CsgD family transcriptional regulator
MFTEAASLREIAAALVISEAGVQQHLLRLYDKFGIAPGTGRRRGQLANEAVRRGAVTLADLRDSSP